jgi:hypothetical protein
MNLIKNLKIVKKCPVKHKSNKKNTFKIIFEGILDMMMPSKQK